MRAHTIGTAAGEKQHPIWVLLDDTASATLHLAPGSQLGAIPLESNGDPIWFVVGAFVHHFPTLYSSHEQYQSTGYIVANQQDLIAAAPAPQQQDGLWAYGMLAAYWLCATASSAETREREHLLTTNPDLYAMTVTDRRALTTRALSDPLNASMSGLFSWWRERSWRHSSGCWAVSRRAV